MKNRSGEKIRLTSIDEMLGVVNEESAMEIEISRIHSFKSAMKQRCDGQRENMLSSLRPTSTNPTFTIISFIIRPRWMLHGNSKTSFFPAWRCKDSAIWFAWNTDCPLLHRSRIGNARKELFIPRSVLNVTNYVMRLIRC